MNFNPDELNLQRCADGELSAQERAAYLGELEKKQSLSDWRELALIMVENQVFSQVVTAETLADSATGTRETVVQVSRRETPRIWHRTVRPWVSITASLLVGGVVGVGSHYLSPRDSEPLLLVKNDAAKSALDGVAVRDVGETHPPTSSGGAKTTLRVRDVHLASEGTNSRNFLQRGAMSPLVNSTQPAVESVEEIPSANAPIPGVDSFVNTREVPEKLRQKLEAEGYRIERRLHALKVTLGDGREIWIPIQCDSIVPE